MANFPNPLQRLTIAGAAVALVTLAFFPPWHHQIKSGRENFIGFHFLIQPGKAVSGTAPVSIDQFSLLACAAIILTIAAVFLLLFHGLAWNPFKTAGAFIRHKVTIALLVICFLVCAVYLGFREYRIAGEVATYNKAVVEWQKRVESGKETDPRLLDAPIMDSLFADNPILSVLGLAKSPYMLIPNEGILWRKAEAQQDRLKAAKPLSHTQIYSLPDKPQ